MAPPANISQTPAHTADCSIPDCRKQKVGGYKTNKALAGQNHGLKVNLNEYENNEDIVRFL